MKKETEARKTVTEHVCTHVQEHAGWDYVGLIVCMHIDQIRLPCLLCNLTYSSRQRLEASRADHDVGIDMRTGILEVQSTCIYPRQRGIWCNDLVLCNLGWRHDMA